MVTPALERFQGSPTVRALLTPSFTGREQWRLIIADTSTGRPTFCLDGVQNFTWADGGEALVYTSLDERGRPSRALVHALGTPHARDRTVMEEPDGAHLLDVTATKVGS